MAPEGGKRKRLKGSAAETHAGAPLYSDIPRAAVGMRGPATAQPGPAAPLRLRLGQGLRTAHNRAQTEPGIGLGGSTPALERAQQEVEL